jgi:hypothetical protein
MAFPRLTAWVTLFHSGDPMRSSPTRSGPSLSVVPRADTSPAAKTLEPPEPEGDSEGTDLSLPQEIAGPLALALDKAGFKLEQADTARYDNDNIHFHRIRGMSSSGESSAALLYVNEKRLEAHQEAWFVYSLSIRICKQFRTRNGTLCIVFLAPESTRFPDTWKQQGEDLEDVGVVTAVNFRSVGSPAKWRAEFETAVQYVHNWLRPVELRPLPPAAQDAFVGRRETRGSGDIPTSPAAGSATLPQVFISYAHEDEKWFDTIRAEVGKLGRYCRVWTDKAIKPGAEWLKSIEAGMASSPVVLLLVSESFLASEFIRSVELKHALDAADEGKKKVLWAYVDKVEKLDDRIRRLQAAHDIKQALERLSTDEQKQQVYKVRDAVADCVKELGSQNAGI